MAQSYKLKSETEDQLHYTESSALKYFIWPFLLVGFAAFAIGLLLLVVAYNEGSTPEVFPFVSTGFGLAFLAATLIIYDSKNANPKHIIFDNKRAAVRIIQKREDATEGVAEIPYQDIEGFSVRETSSSSSSSTRSRTYYVVYWWKRDGSIWDLTRFSSSEKAHQYVQMLSQKVKLDLVCENVMPPKLPPSVKLKKGGGAFVLEWENKFNLKSFGFLMVLTGFALISHGMYLDAEQEGSGFTMAYVFIGFISLITSIFAYYVIRNALLTFRLIVSHKALTVVHVRGAVERKQKEISFDDIAAIGFDFKGDTVGGHPLQVFNQEEFAMIRKAQTNDMALADIGDLFAMAFKGFKINIDALDVVDKIHVEAILQDLIVQKGGVEPL